MPRIGPHHIWRTYTLCPFFGHEKNTDGSTIGLMISLASVCYGYSRVTKSFLHSHLVFQPVGVVGFSTWFQVSVSNRISLMASSMSLIFSLAIAQTPTTVCLYMTGHSCSNLMLLRYEHLLQCSKIDLKLQCDCCIKFQLFEGAQDVFSSVTAVCYMLLPHNPDRLPQYYKRLVCLLVL